MSHIKYLVTNYITNCILNVSIYTIAMLTIAIISPQEELTSISLLTSCLLYSVIMMNAYLFMTADALCNKKVFQMSKHTAKLSDGPSQVV